MLSLSWGSVAMILRRVSTGTASTSPDSAIRALRNTLSPVRRFSSPRNRPGPWVAMTLLIVGIEQDLHPPREDDVEVVARVPCPEEVVAGVDLLACTQQLEEGDFGGIEGRD